MNLMQMNRDESLLQLVTFRVFEEEFGIDILKVQEIILAMAITKVPQAPEFVDGVINLRGKVIPVINLRKCFGADVRDYDRRTRIIVIDLDGTIVGFVVDAVSEVLRIPSSTVEPPPPLVAGVDAEYVTGVGKLNDRLLLLLDLDKLLSDEKKAALQ